LPPNPVPPVAPGNRDRLDAAEALLNASAAQDALDVLAQFRPIPGERWRHAYLEALALFALGQVAEADHAMARALPGAPPNPQLLLRAAVIAQENGDHPRARRLLGEAESYAPKMPEIQLNIGYSADALGDAASARRAYRRFVELVGSDPARSDQRAFALTRLRALDSTP
jgi:Flp pilus assembly protein TadD